MIYKTKYFDATSDGGGMANPYGGISGMVAGGVQQTIGIGQAYLAYEALKKLQKKEKPSYNETPEMTAARSRANQMATTGFTPAETAAYMQNLHRLSTARYNKAIQYGGGNNSQAIQSGINYGNIGALNQYAMQDANLHRSNIRYADTFAQYLQNLKNMNTRNAYSYRLAQEQALGQAMQAGVQNFGNSFQTASSGLGAGSNQGMTSGGGQTQNRVNGQSGDIQHYNNPGYENLMDSNLYQQPTT